MTNPLVVQAAKKLDDLDGDIKRFFDVVNATLTWVPPPLQWVIDKVKDGFRWLGEKPPAPARGTSSSM